MELLSQQFCADQRVDADACEFMREATRGMLEVICPEDISIGTWKPFAIQCAMASVAMACDVPLAKLTDITFERIVPVSGAIPLERLVDLERQRQERLHDELRAMATKLEGLLQCEEYADWHPEFHILIVDLARVMAAFW